MVQCVCNGDRCVSVNDDSEQWFHDTIVIFYSTVLIFIIDNYQSNTYSVGSF